MAFLFFLLFLRPCATITEYEEMIMFSLIAKHDDITFALYHKDTKVAEGAFSRVKNVMVSYGFSLEDIQEAVTIMARHDYNFASFGFNKRFVVAKTIDDERAGRIYNA
jgi:hypothetical protein